jgi:hypothetical protein
VLSHYVSVGVEELDQEKLTPSIFQHLLAVPKDGKPISKYPNQHDAFLEVVNAIRGAAEEMARKSERPSPRLEATAPKGEIVRNPRSSNLRIKKTFTEKEKDDFLEESYEYIANHFEGSLKELETRYDQISTKFRRIDANHFTATIYEDGKLASTCKIWLGGRRSFAGGIVYSADTSSSDNSWNESVSVENDGYSLFLKPMGIAHMRSGNGKGLLSQQGASEYFWEILIQPLQ